MTYFGGKRIRLITEAPVIGNEGRCPLLLTLAPFPLLRAARWALDLQEIVYDEEPLAPGAHVPRVKRLGASRHAPMLTQPCQHGCAITGAPETT